VLTHTAVSVRLLDALAKDGRNGWLVGWNLLDEPHRSAGHPQDRQHNARPLPPVEPDPPHGGTLARQEVSLDPIELDRVANHHLRARVVALSGTGDNLVDDPLFPNLAELETFQLVSNARRIDAEKTLSMSALQVVRVPLKSVDTSLDYENGCPRHSRPRCCIEQHLSVAS